MAYEVVHTPDFEEFLPDGYLHTFQIRHPEKAVPSLYKASVDKESTGTATNICMLREIHRVPKAGLVFIMHDCRNSTICLHLILKL